jgi:hypothetical protein
VTQTRILNFVGRRWRQFNYQFTKRELPRRDADITILFSGPGNETFLLDRWFDVALDPHIDSAACRLKICPERGDLYSGTEPQDRSSPQHQRRAGTENKGKTAKGKRVERTFVMFFGEELQRKSRKNASTIFQYQYMWSRSHWPRGLRRRPWWVWRWDRG